MKKVGLIGALLFAALSSAFAVEAKYESLGFTFSVPFTFESSDDKGVESETSMTSVAFGISSLTMYTDKVGLYASFEFVFPQEMTNEISFGGHTFEYEYSRDDYDSLWGMSALIGLAICISKSDSGIATVSPGLHYTMLFADSAYSASTYLLGIGANIQKSFFFGEVGYFNIGADLAYDFLGTVVVEGESKSGSVRDFSFTPRIGLGFRF